MRHAVLLAALVAALAACDASFTRGRPDVRATIAGLAGSVWRATDVDGRAVLDDPESTLAFESVEQLVGSGGCNRFFGRIRIEEGVLHLGPFGATRRACEPALMDQETRLLRALGDTRALRRENDVLVLEDGDGRPLVRLERRATT